MHHIDRTADAMVDALVDEGPFHGIEPLIREFGDAAKAKCETLRTDPVIFEVWPRPSSSPVIDSAGSCRSYRAARLGGTDTARKAGPRPHPRRGAAP